MHRPIRISRSEPVLVDLGDLVAGVHLGCPVKLLVLLVDVVLLQELGALDLVGLQQLEVSLYSSSSVNAQGQEPSSSLP